MHYLEHRAACYVHNDHSTRTPGIRRITGMVNKLQLESIEMRRRNVRLTMLHRIQAWINWSIYIQTATYNRVTDEQEGNIVSTKKELVARPTVIPSSQEQEGSGTCYHLGRHQRLYWRDSGQTLLFAIQCPPTTRLAIDRSICILTRPVVNTGFNRSLLVDWWSIGRLKKLS